jgi:hypothetical protein
MKVNRNMFRGLPCLLLSVLVMLSRTATVLHKRVCEYGALAECHQHQNTEVLGEKRVAGPLSVPLFAFVVCVVVVYVFVITVIIIILVIIVIAIKHPINDVL